MKIKWYDLAEHLGLVRYEAQEDGSLGMIVSAKCGEVFLAISLCLLLCFFIGLFCIVFFLYKKHRTAAFVLPLVLIGYFILRGILLWNDCWIVLELYPRDVGFIDLSAIGDLFETVLLSLLTLLVGGIAISIRAITASVAKKRAQNQ